MGKICRTCGYKNSSNARRCTRCGGQLETSEIQTVNCGFCGTPNAMAVNYCESCGAHLLKRTPESPQVVISALTVRQVPEPSTTPTIDLSAPTIIKRKTPLMPPLPRVPAKPVKKPIGPRVLSISASILYGCFYLGFFGFVVWLIIVLISNII